MIITIFNVKEGKNNHHFAYPLESVLDYKVSGDGKEFWIHSNEEEVGHFYKTETGGPWLFNVTGDTKITH